MLDLETIRRRPRRLRAAPPLLFVHGAYSAAWCWDEYFLPYLASGGYECHALSLRGHGGSAGDDLLDRAGLDDYVADVRAVARTLDAEPVIVGHSMGGVVAQRYVATHGAAGLVLFASVPPLGLASAAFEIGLRDPDLLTQFALVQSGHGYLANFSRLRHALFAADMPMSRALSYFARMQRESQRALFDLSCLHMSAVRHEVAVPVAVIGGEEDRLFRPEAVRMTAVRHDVQATILPGLGHTMMLDCGWRRAADHLLEWLESWARADRRGFTGRSGPTAIAGHNGSRVRR